MNGQCPYDCQNKTEFGFCRSTGCINHRMMRLIDADELLKKALPKNTDAKFHCVPVEDIEAAPTIEARKKGRWLRTALYYPYCSECGWMPEEDEMRHGDYDYCPSCGSDMREEGGEM